MNRGEVALAFCLGLPACGGASVAPPKAATDPARADQTSDPTPSPTPDATPPPSPTPSPTPTPTSASARPPLPPARRATIALSTGGRGPGDMDLSAGDDAFERGDLKEARARYEAARSAAPGRVPPLVGVARAQMAELDVPLDYAAAKGSVVIAAVAKELTHATKAAPSFGPGFVELGRAMLLLGDAPGAIEALRNGTRLLPGEPEAHSELGVALLATGHAGEAVVELARAVELDPGSAARHGNLGTALMMAGRTKDAIAEYEIRVRMDDGDARAHSDLGTALLGTEDLPRALSELERAVGIEPSRATFHSNLGYAMQQGGRVDRAVAEYREALRLDAQLVSAWINLATALAIDPGTRPEARACLEKARALAPDDPRVKANLAEIDTLVAGHAGKGVGGGRQPVP